MICMNSVRRNFELVVILDFDSDSAAMSGNEMKNSAHNILNSQFRGVEVEGIFHSIFCSPTR